MGRIVVVILASLLWGFVPLVHAEIYKWVDADGNIHFGDKPVDTKKAATAKPVELRNSYTPAQRTEQEQAAFERERMATAQRLDAQKAAREKETRERLAALKEKKARQCADDKEKLRDITEVQINENGRLLYYLEDEKGKPLTLSEQKAAIAALREKIVREC